MTPPPDGGGFLGEVAQLAEHAAENRGVGSSILPLATFSGMPCGHRPELKGGRGLPEMTVPAGEPKGSSAVDAMTSAEAR